MAIVFLEDPTGKIEVTLFPRTFAEAAAFIEQPDTVLVVAGILDVRAGMLQMRVDAVKRASLTTMITKAREAGFFDEEEAKQGIRLVRPQVEAEAIDAVDEEGNVIAGEVVTLGNEVVENGNDADDFFGPIGKWILQGMPTEKELASLGLVDGTSSLVGQDSDPLATNRKSQIANSKSSPSSSSPIRIYTIDLPERAPKKLLLDLKRVLEMFPGSEKVQLKIGEQKIDLPLTVTTSTILEKKVEEAIAEHMVT